jgi:hypothetical protein
MPEILVTIGFPKVSSFVINIVSRNSLLCIILIKNFFYIGCLHHSLGDLLGSCVAKNTSNNSQMIFHQAQSNLDRFRMTSFSPQISL